VRRKDLPRGSSREIYLDLLHALENARGRLAVAIATETKTTTAGRWRHYREVEDRLRRCLKELRCHGPTGLRTQVGWHEALEALKGIHYTSPERMARKDEAMHLCQQLGDVLTPLEQSHTDVRSPRSEVDEKKGARTQEREA
jgi:hypothetical protein